MLKKSKKITLSLALIFALSSCGGGGNSSNKSSENNLTVGYFIDSPVEGINYECGDINGVTDAKGKFACEDTPVVFKLGEMPLGTLDEFTKDGKMYPQDLLGIPRDDFADKELIKLARLLQSLDDDENISQSINIISDTSEYFTSGLSLDKSTLELLTITTSGNLVSEEDAIKHLQNSMGADAYIGGSKDEDEDIGTTSDDILDGVVDNLAEENNTTQPNGEIADNEIDDALDSENSDKDIDSATNENDMGFDDTSLEDEDKDNDSTTDDNISEDDSMNDDFSSFADEEEEENDNISEDDSMNDDDFSSFTDEDDKENNDKEESTEESDGVKIDSLVSEESINSNDIKN